MRFLKGPLFWIGLLVSLGALILAFRGLDWEEVGRALRQANYLLLLPAAIVMFFSLYFRAIRWGVLFHPRTDLRVGALMGTMNVGYSVNNLLPLRVGELVRAYLIGEAEKVSAAHALSTIVVERVLDVLAVVLMLVLLLPFIDVPAWAATPALVAGVVFLVLAVLLATLSLARRWALTMVDKGVRLLPARHQPRLRQAAESVMEGFGVLNKPAVLARGLGWSFASWFCSVLMMFIVQRALGLGVGFEAAVFVVATTSLAMLVPASPGYIGTYELVTIKGLENVFDVSNSTAASCALVQHAFIYVAPMIIAAVYLWRERQAWRQIRFWARQEAPAEEAAGTRST
jgi:glycosyltransferase 2 family protein